MLVNLIEKSKLLKLDNNAKYYNAWDYNHIDFNVLENCNPETNPVNIDKRTYKIHTYKKNNEDYVYIIMDELLEEIIENQYNEIDMYSRSLKYTYNCNEELRFKNEVIQDKLKEFYNMNIFKLIWWKLRELGKKSKI